MADRQIEPEAPTGEAISKCCQAPANPSHTFGVRNGFLVVVPKDYVCSQCQEPCECWMIEERKEA